MKIFKDIFTEPDGESFELLAVLGALAVFVAIVLQVYVSYKSNTFDIINFGTGIGLLLGAVGGGQRLKPLTARQQQDDKKTE